MAVTDAGRRAAERQMTLTVTPYTPTGATTTDPDGYEAPVYAAGTPHPGKVQAGSQAGQDTSTRYVNISGTDRPVVSSGLHVPIGAPVPVAGEQRGVGTEYVVTAVGTYDDPALLNRRCIVVSAPAKSFATARRLDVVWL